jgi:hypothetical protein
VSSPGQPQPRFFLDRSLGRKAVPEALRAGGWNIVTLAEHYGTPADERVADVDWIQESARRVLHSPFRGRRPPGDIM